jgi:hypothetical protein
LDAVWAVSALALETVLAVSESRLVPQGFRGFLKESEIIKLGIGTMQASRTGEKRRSAVERLGGGSPIA